MKILSLFLFTLMIFCAVSFSEGYAAAAEDIDPYEMIDSCGRFPFAKVISLDNGKSWGMIYADVYGKIYLKRWTSKGWKAEWQLTNLGSKVRKFFIIDLEGDGRLDIVIATFSGRILTYSMDGYINTWENIEDDFTSIEAIEISNIDEDPQKEFIVIAGGTMYIIDGLDKSRQWISERKFQAQEIVIANVDTDDAMEIILNTGIVIDAKFRNVELEWDRSFGDRITVFDMNNDGHPEVIGEFTDYSLRIFDIYSEREVW
ncbi:MAG: hypothetical protein JW746_07815 [Candidatus Krumholzibacteriota bacterium]|nr:hypothetical protein [Candidatus Krumholzibacteriota bacterium]